MYLSSFLLKFANKKRSFYISTYILLSFCYFACIITTEREIALRFTYEEEKL